MSDLDLLGYATTYGATPELLNKVADKADATGDTMVLVALMDNDGRPAELVERFSAHAEASVRAAAVRTGLLGHDTLRALAAGDSSLQVLYEVARVAPEDLAETLAGHGEAAVRRGVPENPDCSVEVLKALCADADDAVAAAAREWCGERGIKVDEPDTAGAPVPPGLAGLLEGAAAPEPEPTAAEVTDLLAGDAVARRRCAKVTDLDDTARAALLGDAEAVVRAAFAKREDLTDDEQDALVADADVAVLAAYGINRHADPARRDTLAGHAHPRVRSAVARVTEDHGLQLLLAADEASVQEQLAVRVEELDVDVVVALSRSESRKVRRQVALQRDEAERLDGLWASELVEWRVAAYRDRLAQLVDGDAYDKALEMAPGFPGPLEQLAKVARTLV